MKTILIKLILSLVIAIFLPLPNPIYFDTCDQESLAVTTTLLPSDCKPSVPFLPNGLSFIVSVSNYIYNKGVETRPSLVQNIGIGYGLVALIWMGLAYLLLTVVEFIISKLKKK